MRMRRPRYVRPKCVCGCKDPEERDESIDLLIDTECKCVNPNLECYKDHYDGKCGCKCDDCSDCGCKCILLARLERSGNEGNLKWTADHSVRRFIRPVLMRDPQVEIEEEARRHAEDQAQTQVSVASETMEPLAKASKVARKRGS
jgi:hypothetical protein